METVLQVLVVLVLLVSRYRRECATLPGGFIVLLATFASLRWDEATALRRSDLGLKARTVQVTAVHVERSTGEMLLGPPKSKAVGESSASLPRSSRT